MFIYLNVILSYIKLLILTKIIIFMQCGLLDHAHANEAYVVDKVTSSTL